MGSKYIRKQLMPSLMAGLFLFLSACQGTSRDVEGRIAKVGGEGTGAQVLNRVKNDKELQDNQKSSKQILPFIEAVVPAFSKLGADKGTSWENYLKVKNWYLGTESLSAKFNGLLSITRYEGSDDILAHQSLYEVFINSVLFEKLTKEKQQNAILEEFLISLFTLKHLEDAQLCALVKEINASAVKECAKHADGSRAVSEDLEAVAESKTNTPPRARNSAKTADKETTTTKNPRDKMIQGKSVLGNDMKDIMAAAAYLKELDASNVDTQNVINTLKSLHFDVRIFDYKLGMTVAEGNKSSQTITVEERNLIVSQMKTAAEKDLNCSFHGSKAKSQICGFSVESLTDEKAKGKMLSLKIEVEGKKAAEDTILLSDKDGVIQVGYYTDATTKVKYMLIPVATASLPKDQQKENSLYRGYYIMATIGKAGLEFAGVYSAPGIVTSTTVQDDKVTCVGAANFTEETPGIFVSVTSNSIGEAFMKNMAPQAPCY